MHVAQYFVMFHDNEWRIRYKGTYYGPYDRQKTAISQAIDMALIVGQSGGKAEVLVENEKGEARLEWPLSHDQAAADRGRFLAPQAAPTATPARPQPVPQPDVPPAPAPATAPAIQPAPLPPAPPVVAEDGAEEAHDEESAPPRESSIEELAAIMAAALDGAETLPPPRDVLPMLPGDDEGPGTVTPDTDPGAPR